MPICVFAGVGDDEIDEVRDGGLNSAGACVGEAGGLLVIDG
jgi:hypothetical protein